ncbi:YraN family protein [Oscillibacter sp.]|uniref:YraN family protein n=1 Tax=Oscillibacter sp. TaxID=1945593 RepID=UPI002D8087C4|nr:YraN family protein [Oscillibacter sp.]
MSGTGKKASGDQGEALAARYLEERGYTILNRQWRCRFGELDLVARSPDGVLCFVEVKRRGPGSIGLPREFVDGRKQQRLRRAANLYLGFHGLDCPARFDVAEVYEGKDGGLQVEYLEDAFA